MTILIFLSLAVLQVGLQIFDILTTLDALRMGAREVFWVARFFLKFGSTGLIAMKSIITAVLLVGCYSIFQDSPAWSIGCLIVANLFYLGILINNRRVIQQLKLQR
tara:strand:- start:1140 stop:1457 length:318 start_codon:yes stop_codon:yes gene_type:complete